MSPMSRTGGPVVYGSLNWGTQVSGVGVDWPFIRSWNTSEGTFFGDSEVRSAAKVVVLGSTVANALFGDQNPVGATVRIKNFPFRVIGVAPGICELQFTLLRQPHMDDAAFERDAGWIARDLQSLRRLLEAG